MEGWLSRNRAASIIESLKDRGEAFTCHKTNDYDSDDEEGVVTMKSKGCAGAAILLKKNGMMNTPLQVATRLGLTNLDDFKNEDQVFDTFDEFINHHES